MPGQDHDGHGDTALAERLLHLETIHFGHAYIEQNAARLGTLDVLQEFDAGNPGRNGKSGRLEHEAGRTANSVLIVDNVDHTLINHPTSPAPLLPK